MSVLTFTPAEIAANMLKRYSSAKVALEMANCHACDYPESDPRRAHWVAVKDEMKKLIAPKGTP